MRVARTLLALGVLSSDRSGLATFAALPKLSLVPLVAVLRDRVMDVTWHHANDLDFGFRPTSIRLARDWTYTSGYRFGACQNSGTGRSKDVRS